MYFREVPTPHIISQKEARILALNSQGLLNHSNSSLEAISQLTYIQIDTISVTERCHNHVIHTRNPSFNQDELSHLMEEKSIFEYWSHAAAYLPIEDFRYSLYRKEQYKNGGKHWFPRDKKVDKYVMDRIKTEGPLQSKDFDHPQKTNGWYEWKPAKIALTNLFMDGSLMISNRKGFQKIFDLTERVISTDIDISSPTLDEYCNHLIINSLKSHGLVSVQEMSYLRRGVKPVINKLLAQLVEEGKIVPVRIASSTVDYFTTKELLSSIDLRTDLNKVHILSPFDNLIIQRKRAKELFNFDYQIECYVPEKKRKYGYYVLPILFGDEFVGRLDAKADRKTKQFTIKGVWFENGFKPNDTFYKTFTTQLYSFSKFCGCEKIKVNKVSPNSFKKDLNSFI